MERYSMFLGRKNQCYENNYTTKCNLQIQCDQYQITNGIFHRTRTVLLPGKSHGRRSLVGCSPWGHEESDTTEWLHFHFSLSCIGEGNGNPLQCSCLENPRDGEAWWAAVYGIAQSWTRLMWLSSSRAKNFTIHTETPKTPNSQSSLEKEEWSWRNQSSWLQIILQSYSYQDSMVLAQKTEI